MCVCVTCRFLCDQYVVFQVPFQQVQWALLRICLKYSEKVQHLPERVASVVMYYMGYKRKKHLKQIQACEQWYDMKWYDMKWSWTSFSLFFGLLMWNCSRGYCNLKWYSPITLEYHQPKSPTNPSPATSTRMVLSSSFRAKDPWVFWRRAAATAAKFLPLYFCRPTFSRVKIADAKLWENLRN